VPDRVPWWKSGVVYQIYPRSFADSNGDGVGDLGGIRSRLDHLAWLGVDAIWLSPIFTSPMADFGYDVSDYQDVDPVFGSLADLDRLVADAHARGIRVLLDWVPNHTSSLHPWFVESRSSRASAKRGWYVWRDPKPDGSPPNNWTAAFSAGGPAWTFDRATGQSYLHLFLPEQPDLNWSNRDVRAAMYDVLRFWLDRGIDGFRVDVVHALGKDPALPDDPPEMQGVPHCALHDDESTHPILRELRSVVDAYPGDRMLVGEVYIVAPHDVTRYYGRGDELHLCFDLPAVLHTPWEAEAWRSRTESVMRAYEPIGAWPTIVLSNHDTPRHRTRLGSEARARAAALLILTLPGTPFLYAGEELGLEDALVPRERRVDPGNRDGCRAPLPWDGSPSHGWGEEPWLPWPPEAERQNAETLRADPRSILHLYRRLLAARRASAALTSGGWTALDAPQGVLAYRRETGGDRRVAVVNFTSEPRRWDPPAGSERLRVEVSTSGDGEGRAWGGALAPDEAVLLVPGRG